LLDSILYIKNRFLIYKNYVLSNQLFNAFFTVTVFPTLDESVDELTLFADSGCKYTDGGFLGKK
jgi:hypothetical protein